MHSLITARFQSATAARGAHKTLMDLPSQYLADVADGVIVTADPDGTFRLEQVVNFWTTEPDTLSLILLVRWTLFVQPLLGIVNGPEARALRDTLDDFGISSGFVTRLQSDLITGHAALIVMPRNENVSFMLEPLQSQTDMTETLPLEDLYQPELQRAFREVLGLIRDHRESFGGTAA
jgi:uncharacterized membrane protein